MNVRLVIIGLVAGSVVAALVASLLLIGPRMKVQPHLLAYQDTLCEAPEGSVPVEGGGLWPDSGQATLPPAVKPGAAAGRVFYGYYCECCHGEAGDGNGPVGESYVPRPADLRTGEIRRLSDSVLTRAMLLGPGHTVEHNGTVHPVLARIIPPGDLPSIVLYVKTLGDR
jgi:hypothetical protein